MQSTRETNQQPARSHKSSKSSCRRFDIDKTTSFDLTVFQLYSECMYIMYILVTHIGSTYINKTGDEPRTHDTQANKRTHPSEGRFPTKLPRSDSDNGKEVGIGGGGRKSSGRCSRRMTATLLRTWKVRADLRNVVMDEVAHEVS